MEKKEMYVAPEVEILEVSVEKGFAATDTTGGIGEGGQTPEIPDGPF